MQPSPSGSLGPGGTGVQPKLDLKIAFKVVVPAAAAAAAFRRRAALAHRQLPAAAATVAPTTPYISANAASITLQLLAVDGVSLAYPPPAPTTAALGCPLQGAGCTLSVGGVIAAAGIDRYLVTTYTEPGGLATAGNTLVSSTLIDVSVGASGSVQATLGDPTELAVGGFVESLALSLEQKPDPFVIDTPGSGTVLVVPKDAAGATIVGLAQFVNPVTVLATGTGLSLTGPGVQPDGSYLLTGPETSTSLIGISYDGTSLTASIQAATTDPSGNHISAAPARVAIAVTAPTPSPSGSQAPTPPPTQSLYVVNAGNDTVSEFLLASGLPSTYRRSVSAISPCPSKLTTGAVDNFDFGYGLSGIAEDQNGTVYFGQSGDTCASPHELLYAFGPAALGTAGVTSNTSPEGYGARGDIDLAFDTSAGLLVLTRGTGPGAGTADPWLFGQLAYNPSGNAVATLENDVGDANGVPCAVSAGLPALSGPCSENTTNQSANFTAYRNYVNLFSNGQYAPLASDRSGTTYQYLLDEYDQNPSPAGSGTYGNGALVAMADSANLVGQSGGFAAAANATWIEGPDTLIDSDVGTAAIAYDPSVRRLYALEYADFANVFGGFSANGTQARPDLCTGSTGAPSPYGTQNESDCKDGSMHYYIIGFDLAQLPATKPNPRAGSAPGAVDAAPQLVIGGDALHLPALFNWNSGYFLGENTIPENGFFAAGGKLYLVNPIGPACNLSCYDKIAEHGIASGSGEIEVYDGTATGYFNDATPGSVLLDSFKSAQIDVPVGLVAGSSGAATAAPASNLRPAR